MSDVEGKVIAQVREELEKGKFHPLGKEDTSGFLCSFAARLSAQGEFRPNDAPKSIGEHPLIGRSPVVFLRSRNLGFAVAIRSALEHLAASNTIPSSLLRIVGIEDEQGEETEANVQRSWLDDRHASCETGIVSYAYTSPNPRGQFSGPDIIR
jgi:hypothetical protein